jgi:hypothetical protein
MCKNIEKRNLEKQNLEKVKPRKNEISKYLYDELEGEAERKSAGEGGNSVEIEASM